jgi:hypothetical protein
MPGNLWEMLVKDSGEPVDSSGERSDCPDLGCSDLASSVHLAGGQHVEGVVGFCNGSVAFLFWQPHWCAPFPAPDTQARRQRMTENQ